MFFLQGPNRRGYPAGCPSQRHQLIRGGGTVQEEKTIEGELDA